jgi:hypothetical protein
MEEHEPPQPDSPGDVPQSAEEGQKLQEGDPRITPNSRSTGPEGTQDSARISPKIPRLPSKARGVRATLPSSAADPADAVWDEYFRLCERRIAYADHDRYSELRKVRKRKAAIFIALCIMAALTIINLAIASSLAVFNAIHTGPANSELMHNLIASGGGLVGTGGITGALALARRALRSDEQALTRQGREMTHIQAVMVAARVTRDEERRCEFLGDMTRSLNALLREEEPEAGRKSRRRQEKD